MKPIRALIFVSILFLLPSAITGQDKPNPTPIPWQTISTGLSFLRWEVRSQNIVEDTIAILRIHPEYWSFKVFFNREPKTIREWQQSTGATVVCNGGFYLENFQPAGKILVNGTFLGPL
jgi:hypothetical protein